ncbi:hypothetical protein SS50377_25579 [Spironucleus salmonicida]|uniref:Uncharacterized protein n=1 Tax=Spironucleus salmonicida TaxID=348837 RepID=V6LN42_9EUKA|nr:hypothetical protein SS50377_25579 [Spironucleus salmonicida]|eukprot:EST45126.1 Hypothetical protein SS50377_15148 [Spironucleus salmonicida]
MNFGCNRCILLEEQILELQELVTQEQQKRNQTSMIAEMLRDTCMNQIQENEKEISELKNTIQTKEEIVNSLNSLINTQTITMKEVEDQSLKVTIEFQKSVADQSNKHEEIKLQKIILEEQNSKNFNIITELQQQKTNLEQTLNTQEVLFKEQADKLTETTNFIAENDIKNEQRFKTILADKERYYIEQIADLKQNKNQLYSEKTQLYQTLSDSKQQLQKQQSQIQIYEQQFEDSNNLLVNQNIQIKELAEQLSYIQKSLKISNEKIEQIEKEKDLTTSLLQTTQIEQQQVQHSQITAKQYQLEMENEKTQKLELLNANITLNDVLMSKDEQISRLTIEITKLNTKLTQYQRNDILACNQIDINVQRLTQYYQNAITKVIEGHEFVAKASSSFETKLQILGEELGEFTTLSQIKEFIIYNFDERVSILIQNILTMDLYSEKIERKGICKMKCFPFDSCGGTYELIIVLAFLLWVQM